MAARRWMDQPTPPSSAAAAAVAVAGSVTQLLLDLEVKEEFYSMELARRAVARAAIHLGIESMSERALDVLADVLLSFLSRTGSALSHLVESSGRTSAHANVLDALQACQLVAAPAVQRVYVSTSSSSAAAASTTAEASAAAAADAVDAVSTTTTDAVAAPTTKATVGGDDGDTKMNTDEATGHNNKLASAEGTVGAAGKTDGTTTTTTATTTQDMMIAMASSADWKGLASFLFGPNWYEESHRDNNGTATKTNGAQNVAEQQQQNPRKQEPSGDKTESSSDSAAAGDVGGDDDRMDVDNEKGTTKESDGKAVNKSSDEGGDQSTDQQGDGPNGRGVGGKALTASDPSVEDGGVGVGAAVSRPSRGWNAPYFDEVPDYPQATETCANPHALPARIGLSLHRKIDVTEEEADEELTETENVLEIIPDAVFGTATSIRRSDDVDGPASWGSLKRKQHDAEDDSQDADMIGDGTSRRPKRIKISEQKAGQVDKEEVKLAAIDSTEKIPYTTLSATILGEKPDPSKFAYVPSFYPTPPPTDRVMDRGRTVVDLTEPERHRRQKMLLKSASTAVVKSLRKEDRANEEAADVRSSLVQLDQYQYWGSGWDDSSQSNSASGMVVPLGRPQSAARTGGDGSVLPAGAAPGQGQAAEVPIVPINRASLSTVSRILEGSVDAATM